MPKREHCSVWRSKRWRDQCTTTNSTAPTIALELCVMSPRCLACLVTHRVAETMGIDNLIFSSLRYAPAYLLDRHPRCGNRCLPEPNLGLDLKPVGRVHYCTPANKASARRVCDGGWRVRQIPLRHLGRALASSSFSFATAVTRCTHNSGDSRGIPCMG